MALQEIRELGKGTFGRVYLAFDDGLGHVVAVKELLDPTADLDRFDREGRILFEQINNQYVVNIYRRDLTASRPHLVLEYCEGGSMRAQVGKTDWRRAATALLHASNGLLGIHRVGGFHRDLKPENLLLARTPDGTAYIVKVADFGLARRPATALPPMTRSIGGTEGYIAPDPTFTDRSDIFSLGVIGIELMSGSQEVQSLEWTAAPDDFKGLLRRMTSPWAPFRPTAADLIVELGRLLGLQPPAPTPPPRVVEPTPAPPPRGGGLGGLLVAGGLLAAVAALAAGNTKGWDDNVGRYRSRDGRFRKG
jgi:serine/threonine protein kinase